MKKFFYFTIPILILLFVFNIYIFYNNSSVHSKIESNNTLRIDIKETENFRSELLTMSNMSKYYIITGNTSYLNSYSNALDKSYEILSDLTDSGVITSDESQSINLKLNQYNDITESITPIDSSSYSNDNMEAIISKLIAIEGSISNLLNNNIVNNIDKMNTTADTVSSTINSQSGISQIVSTIFTILAAIPFYFLKKIRENPTGTLEDVLKNISLNKSPSDGNESNPEKCLKDNDNNYIYSNETLNEIENKLVERAVFLSYLKTIYSHNDYMKEQWTQGTLMINEIDVRLNKLISDVKSIKEYSSIISSEDIEILKDQVNELQCMFEQLPNYHNFIMELTKNIMVE